MTGNDAVWAVLEAGWGKWPATATRDKRKWGLPALWKGDEGTGDLRGEERIKGKGVGWVYCWR